MAAWLLPLEARVAWHLERAKDCRKHLADIERNEKLFHQGITPSSENMVFDRSEGVLDRFATAKDLRSVFEELRKADIPLLPSDVRELTESEQEQNARALDAWRATVAKTAQHHENEAEKHASSVALRSIASNRGPFRTELL